MSWREGERLFEGGLRIIRWDWWGVGTIRGYYFMVKGETGMHFLLCLESCGRCFSIAPICSNRGEERYSRGPRLWYLAQEAWDFVVALVSMYAACIV